MRSRAATDPRLRELKTLFEAGTDCGPHFDRGALSVIHEIVKKQSFVPNPIVSTILLAAKARKANAESPLPPVVEQLLQTSQWTLEDAIEFAKGIEYAEYQFDKFETTAGPKPRTVDQ